MTEFEKQQSEFNKIQSEYLFNNEYDWANEKVDDLEEFYNEIRLNKNENKLKDSSNQNDKVDLASKLSSIKGETAAKGVAASISSSMGTVVSAIALCAASVGVNASYSQSNNVPIDDSPAQIVQEQSEYVYSEVEDTIEDIIILDEQKDIPINEVKELERFEARAENYNGVYDGNGHSGNIVNIPEGAVITYGESIDSCILSEAPEFTDAGQYIVYYKVSGDGYETHYGSYVVTIDKRTVSTPAPSVDEIVYNGEEQKPDLKFSEEYRYYGITSAKNAGTYKLNLELTDPKNYKWADGSSEDKQITWVIKPRELTIEWNDKKNYIYNGQNHVIDVTLGNVIPGDFLNFTVKGNSARNPGTYTAQVTEVRGSDNYVLPKDCSYNWHISEN